MSDVQVVVSDLLPDIDAAMVLVHDGFVESGYLPPQSSGRRMIPHYLTPGAQFGLAMGEDDAPAAVMTLLPDGAWGLPCEAAFGEEIAALRRVEGPLQEVGSLVVSGAHRGSTRPMFMALVAATMRAGFVRHPEGTFVIAVAPEQERFYHSLCALTRVGPDRDLYGAPAVLMRVGVRDCIAAVMEGASITRRALQRLISDPHPGWLQSRLSWCAGPPGLDVVPGGELSRDAEPAWGRA